MLYREVLLGLGDPAPAFLTTLSQRHRDRLQEEILAIYALYEQHGAVALRQAMTRAMAAGAYQAEALALLLAAPSASAPVLVLPGIPAQAEVDRALASYEAWVQVEPVQEVNA